MDKTPPIANAWGGVGSGGGGGDDGGAWVFLRVNVCVTVGCLGLV